MIGLIFATHIEAEPFLNKSQAIQIHKTPLAIYQVPSNPRLIIIISGIGKVSAAVACHCQIKELNVDEIVNAGVCGALRDDNNYAPGKLLCIASVVEGDHMVVNSACPPLMSDGHFDWDLPAARLVTCDKPVFDASRRKALSTNGDLIDMEGAAIARVATMYGVPWSMIKGITDTAGPDGRALLKQNLPLVSENICEVLWRQFMILE